MSRPVGRGGSSGFERTPLLASRRFIYTALTVHFKCPTVRKWSTSSLTAIENHRCPSKSGCSYAGLRTSAERARVNCLRRCDERPRVNTCGNKSLCQALESSPVVLLLMSHPTYCSATLSTFSRGNLKPTGLANACRTAKIG